VNIFRERLRTRGARGLIGIRRAFTIADEDGSNSLSFDEFKKAL
jgi:hypothetical protein